MQRKHSHCIVMHHWPTMMPLHCLESGHIMILRCRGITTLSVSQSLSVSPVKRLIFLSSTPQSEWWPYTYRFNIQPIIWPNLLMSNSRKIHNQLHNQLQQLPSYNQITTKTSIYNQTYTQHRTNMNNSKSWLHYGIWILTNRSNYPHTTKLQPKQQYKTKHIPNT